MLSKILVLFIICCVFSCKSKVKKILIGDGKVLWRVVKIDSIESDNSNTYYVFSSNNTYQELIKKKNRYYDVNSNEDILDHLTWESKANSQIRIGVINYEVGLASDSTSIFIKVKNPLDPLKLKSEYLK